jgi:hypothetical protein
MAYNIDSGNIQAGVLYQVYGSSGTLTYNSIVYTPGETFRGVTGTGTFSHSGDTVLQEVTELSGTGAAFVQDSADLPVFAEKAELCGAAITFDLSPEEQIVNETTRIQGFALELIDYPFFSFEITETRL